MTLVLWLLNFKTGSLLMWNKGIKFFFTFQIWSSCFTIEALFALQNAFSASDIRKIYFLSERVVSYKWVVFHIWTKFCHQKLQLHEMLIFQTTLVCLKWGLACVKNFGKSPYFLEKACLAKTQKSPFFWKSPESGLLIFRITDIFQNSRKLWTRPVWRPFLSKKFSAHFYRVQGFVVGINMFWQLNFWAKCRKCRLSKREYSMSKKIYDGKLKLYDEINDFNEFYDVVTVVINTIFE